MQRASGSSILVRSFRLYLQVEGLRPQTVKHYVHDAERFLTWLGERPLTAAKSSDVREYFQGLTDRLAAKTVREAQLGLRRFFRFLVSEGEVKADPMREMKLMNFRTRPQATYSEAEVKKLLLVCDPSTREGIRDTALVMILFDTGVREGELVSMTVPDFDRRRVTVSGKTGYRAIPLGTAALQALDRYVRRWRLSDGLLWRGLAGPLTESGVLQVVRRLCDRAGVERKGVHAFRRAAAAQMKRLGMNDSDILESWVGVM